MNEYADERIQRETGRDDSWPRSSTTRPLGLERFHGVGKRQDSGCDKPADGETQSQGEWK